MGSVSDGGVTSPLMCRVTWCKRRLASAVLLFFCAIAMAGCSSGFRTGCMETEAEWTDLMEKFGESDETFSRGEQSDICSCLEAHAVRLKKPIETQDDWKRFNDEIGTLMRPRCAIEIQL